MTGGGKQWDACQTSSLLRLPHTSSSFSSGKGPDIAVVGHSCGSLFTMSSLPARQLQQRPGLTGLACVELLQDQLAALKCSRIVVDDQVCWLYIMYVMSAGTGHLG